MAPTTMRPSLMSVSAVSARTRPARRHPMHLGLPLHRRRSRPPKTPVPSSLDHPRLIPGRGRRWARVPPHPCRSGIRTTFQHQRACSPNRPPRLPFEVKPLLAGCRPNLRLSSCYYLVLRTYRLTLSSDDRMVMFWGCPERGLFRTALVAGSEWKDSNHTISCLHFRGAGPQRAFLCKAFSRRHGLVSRIALGVGVEGASRVSVDGVCSLRCIFIEPWARGRAGRLGWPKVCSRNSLYSTALWLVA